MRAVDKKEYMVVLIIFIAAVLMFTLISRNHPDIVQENPDQATVLNDKDMTITSALGKKIVGKSTRDDALKVFPNGDNLGISGVYRPKGMDCLLSFSKKEDVLIRVDIGICDLSTSRGIKANDSFDKVVAVYGTGYTKSYDKTTPQIFDIYYGSDQYILFKVENNLVKKIYIGSPVQ